VAVTMSLVFKTMQMERRSTPWFPIRRTPICGICRETSNRRRAIMVIALGSTREHERQDSPTSNYNEWNGHRSPCLRQLRPPNSSADEESSKERKGRKGRKRNVVCSTPSESNPSSLHKPNATIKIKERLSTLETPQDDGQQLHVVVDVAVCVENVRR
jgi:hypothetical protein